MNFEYSLVRKFGIRILMATLVALVASTNFGPAAVAADGPGIDALNEFRGKSKDNRPAVENRFFLKNQRYRYLLHHSPSPLCLDLDLEMLCIELGVCLQILPDLPPEI